MIPSREFELIRSVIRWYTSEREDSTLTNAQLDVWVNWYLSENPLSNSDDALPPYDTNSG